jgi:NAD+ synthase (glutamine-hydrolysing)
LRGTPSWFSGPWIGPDTFPELVITGYPPEDLLLKPQFIKENLRCLQRVARGSSGIAAVVGYVDSASDLYNSAAVLYDGEVAGTYRKIHLPNYGVFDEKRYFQQGREVKVFRIAGVNVGVSICEDIWQETGPVGIQAVCGAEVLVNISASPYHRGKGDQRRRVLAARASDNLAFLVYNNLVGGQDELVFDGQSMVLGHDGELIARGGQFEEDLVVADLDADSVFRERLHDPRWRDGADAARSHDWDVLTVPVSEAASPGGKPPLPGREVQELGYPGEVYQALVLGTHDYVTKNGFEKVVIGLSGGIDSSLVATIAVDALGAGNVVGVAMPSRYSSPGSLSDAQELAGNLGIRLLKIPIEEAFSAYLRTLAPAFEGTQPGVAEENIQARIRGNLIMALSNKFGWLVLATGNKSEMATGYSTLYGDMCGGLAVIKDVPKTMVYELAHHRNSVAGRELIPRSVLDKVPSAELRPNQRDSDSLPPYEMLDPILAAYVEEDRSIDEIVAMGFPEGIVRKSARLVDSSEFKRRQSTPGIKITPRAFGKDRRIPITNRYRP